MKNNLINFLAKSCHYAQEHIDDADAWDISFSNRENLLQCVSYQVACFLAQNTVKGDNGVGWEIVIDDLVTHPMKSEKEWKNIINTLIKDLGGLKN